MFERTRAHIERWGWWRTLLDKLHRSARKFLGIHVYLLRVREQKVADSLPQEADGFVFRRIEADKLRELCQQPDLDLAPAFVEAAIERGDVAFGVFYGNELGSYAWRSVTSAPHTDEIWARLKPPYCYSYKQFTPPAYRGRRLGTTTALFADSEMCKRGYTHVAGYVSMTNYASIAMGNANNSEIIGRGIYLSWFGQLFQFRSKRLREIGFEFYRPS